jgi:hypothetical protein
LLPVSAFREKIVALQLATFATQSARFGLMHCNKNDGDAPFRLLVKLMQHFTRAARGRAEVPIIAMGGSGAIGKRPASSLTY